MGIELFPGSMDDAFFNAWNHLPERCSSGPELLIFSKPDDPDPRLLAKYFNALATEHCLRSENKFWSATTRDDPQNYATLNKFAIKDADVKDLPTSIPFLWFRFERLGHDKNAATRALERALRLCEVAKFVAYGRNIYLASSRGGRIAANLGKAFGSAIFGAGADAAFSSAFHVNLEVKLREPFEGASELAELTIDAAFESLVDAAFEPDKVLEALGGQKKAIAKIFQQVDNFSRLGRSLKFSGGISEPLFKNRDKPKIPLIFSFFENDNLGFSGVSQEIIRDIIQIATKQNWPTLILAQTQSFSDLRMLLPTKAPEFSLAAHAKYVFCDSTSLINLNPVETTSTTYKGNLEKSFQTLVASLDEIGVYTEAENDLDGKDKVANLMRFRGDCERYHELYGHDAGVECLSATICALYTVIALSYDPFLYRVHFDFLDIMPNIKSYVNGVGDGQILPYEELGNIIHSYLARLVIGCIECYDIKVLRSIFATGGLFELIIGIQETIGVQSDELWRLAEGYLDLVAVCEPHSADNEEAFLLKAASTLKPANAAALSYFALRQSLRRAIVHYRIGRTEIAIEQLNQVLSTSNAAMSITDEYRWIENMASRYIDCCQKRVDKQRENIKNMNFFSSIVGTLADVWASK